MIYLWLFCKESDLIVTQFFQEQKCKLMKMEVWELLDHSLIQVEFSEHHLGEN